MANEEYMKKEYHELVQQKIAELITTKLDLPVEVLPEKIEDDYELLRDKP